MKNILMAAALAFLSSAPLFGQWTLDLSGQWQFQIDRDDVGIAQQWYNRSTLDDQIELPASMAERLKGDLPDINTQWTASIYDSSFYYNPALAKYREPGDNFSLPFSLTPTRVYVGSAWYIREFDVPAMWKGQRVEFSMERPHIKTWVWVNGDSIGSVNTLCEAHTYDITRALKPGQKNRIAVLVNNTLQDVPVGKDSHSVTDQTQGNWNGITGFIRLRTTDAVHLAGEGDLNSVEVYPDIHTKSARVHIGLANESSSKQTVMVHLSAAAYNTPAANEADQIFATQSVTLQPGAGPISFDVQLEGLDCFWDEFSPTLYRLNVFVMDKRGRRVLDLKELTFGMREIKCEGKYFYVNGERVLLRGTVENCDFPLTGYCPTDLQSWRRVFEICKEYGLNHMRFHSYCPTEACLQAADESGFYLQVEGPSWPNHGIKLGRRDPVDTYLMDETKRIVRMFGSHPSFTMLSAGNEPAGAWVPWASKFVEYWKEHDPRHVYTGFSVGGGWDWQPKNQYHSKAGNRGLDDWNRNRPGTLADFQHAKFKGGAEFDKLEEPFVCHEMGQWCVFPDFKETSQYTGVMQPRNFNIFKDVLAQNDMSELAEDFLMASGKLQALCYKYEIEKLRRTPGYAGYQLLALNDYSGQGTALEGVLNVFFENKGYISAEEWREFCAPVVITMQTPRFVWKESEKIDFRLDVSDFSNDDHTEARLDYTWSNADAPAPCQRTLTATLTMPDGTQVATNHWNFWIYPDETPSVPEQATTVLPKRLRKPSDLPAGYVHICDTLDERARQILDLGGKVLLLADGKVSYGRDIVQHFTPVFWNTSWFKMRPPHTTGVLVRDEHPAFSEFPTSYHSDLQWWELLNRTQVMLFSDFPQGFQPLVQSIDTWFFSRKCGVLFEAKVGNGRLVMTTMDLHSDLDNRFVARQMRHSLLEYMQGDSFDPQFAVDVDRVADLFTKVAPAYNSYVNESPDELKPGYEKPKK